MCTTNELFSKGFRLFEDVEADLTSTYGNWEVKEDGGLLYHGSGIKAVEEVDASQLKNIDLVHLMNKKWNDYKEANDFFLAYLEALRLAGFHTLTINLNNHNLSKVES